MIRLPEARQRAVPVSVIIPTFNRRQVVGRAIRSVLKQSFSPEQIIVIDDGSTDATGAMIRQEFPQIEYRWQEQAGVSAARNAAIRSCSGEWIALLDSDDEWLPHKLERQLALIKAGDDLKICHTEEIWIRNGKRVNQKKKHQKKGGWIFRDCLPLCAMSPSSILIHRSVFDAVGEFDESLPACEDYDLWLRITQRFPVGYVDEPMILKYGGHDDQLSQKYWGMDRFRIQALEKILHTGLLSTSERQAVLRVLIDKAGIFAMGARKRGKTDQADHYQEITDRYQKLLFSDTPE